MLLENWSTTAKTLAPLLSKLDIKSARQFGADGNINVCSEIVLTRDVDLCNLTVFGDGKIITNGYKIFVSGSLDLQFAQYGAIQHGRTTTG